MNVLPHTAHNYPAPSPSIKRSQKSTANPRRKRRTRTRKRRHSVIVHALQFFSQSILQTCMAFITNNYTHFKHIIVLYIHLILNTITHLSCCNRRKYCLKSVYYVVALWLLLYRVFRKLITLFYLRIREVYHKIPIRNNIYQIRHTHHTYTQTQTHTVYHTIQFLHFTNYTNNSY